ncbi:MAG: type II secretion system F family protein [Candidatus Nanoarchaeia archaeon]
MKPVLDKLEEIEQKIKEKREEFSIKHAENRSKNAARRRQLLRSVLDKSGLRISAHTVKRIILVLIVIANIAFISYYLYSITRAMKVNLGFLLFSVIVLVIFTTAVSLFVLWLLFYFTLDILIYKRKVEIEDVLPDFLQLTSANIRAGMPMDRALWFSIRPRFGVLAKEMEEVAKRTLTGEELEVALRGFSEKYDSLILKRSVYLLIEGVKAGGEVGELLDRIGSNIQQIKMMQKEMAANVMTYVIFISVAVVFGAPFLFGLASALIGIIQQIGSMIDISQAGVTGMSFKFSPNVIDPKEFKIFAILSLSVTSLSASAIISTIQKGSVKAGLKYIPMFATASIVLFLLFSSIFNNMLSGFF